MPTHPTPVRFLQTDFPDAARPSRLEAAGNPAAKLLSDPFTLALRRDMAKANDTAATLHSHVLANGGRISVATLKQWRRGARSPRASGSFRVLEILERRYARKPGSYASLLPHRSRAMIGFRRLDRAPYTKTHLKRVAWHLPTDFDRRDQRSRSEILRWIDENVLTAGTDYQAYMRTVRKDPKGMRISPKVLNRRLTDRRGNAYSRSCPPGLSAEVEDLLTFKMAALAPIGILRSGVWSVPTAGYKVDQLGLVFGVIFDQMPNDETNSALYQRLSMAHLTFPAIWEKFLHWQFTRRSFYTCREVDILRTMIGLTNPDCGWLSRAFQPPKDLPSIEGLVTKSEVDQAQSGWVDHCKAFLIYARQRVRDLVRLSRKHRDCSLAIRPVLDSDRPLDEYAKIARSLIGTIPTSRFPISRAEVLRNYIALRLAMRTGLRQRNLRELLVCRAPDRFRPVSELENLRRGELRTTSSGTWEIYLPSVAFKNSDSTFFRRQPVRYELSDGDGLHCALNEYFRKSRMALMAGRPDDGNLFVTSPSARRGGIAYTDSAFYQMWRQIIERHGIYNPYTKRGAIPGLLPHGPHAIRDVIATHVLKLTGSFEKASYAIHVSPATAQAHYARYLPSEKVRSVAHFVEEPFMTTS